MPAAIISLIIIGVAIYILAIITEHFFVPSLDQVAKRLDMPHDVAGASLMAVGSSAPELFIALTAIFIGSENASIGIGTIVGSAVFNILVITGASALIAGDLVVKKGAVERDIIVYLLSVGLLLFVFIDGQIVLWEAVVMFLGYVSYLAVLWYWGENVANNNQEGGEENSPEVKEEHTVTEKKQNIFAIINTIISRLFGIIARDPEKQYVWAMLVSIAAIAGLSFILVEATIILSEALNLPSLIVSMTLLAAGTSAPDLIASVDVARDGRGSMAIANAVGSDIFDVLIGLSVPWLIALTALGAGVIEIDTSGLMNSIFLLLFTTGLLYLFLYTDRKLTRREGILLLIAYAIYVAYAFFNTTGG
jgi:K+-dependent Na+/Ca+ exchanger-like protein